MAQLFRPGANTLARLLIAFLVLGPFAAAMVGGAVTRSDSMSGRGRYVEQPVPFSHQHHAGELGMDCRNCHTSVENSASAGFPPTHTCMSCHSQLWTDADMLEPVRASVAQNRPLRWNKVNRLPGYVYFDHHVHVANGVPCAACHGPIRTMPLTRQTASLSMNWCVGCHRDPADRIVAPAREYEDSPYLNRTAADRAFSNGVLATIATRHHDLTDCSQCHR